MNALLSVRDLTLGFYGAQILRGVDFSIREGTITGLIGPNGAGKSTLFNAISGLYRPNGGKVMLAGDDVTGLKPHLLVRRGLVRTFQLARGFPKLSVFQHLMLYGLDQPGEGLAAALFTSPAARRREQELAEKALNTARRLRLSHVVDNPVTALSGGQKKLVEIGRALMADPRLILLDEPMAGVNPSLADEIAEHLVALNGDGITVCLIEHDMALIKRLCDPVVVLAEGKTLVEGNFDEVAADPEVQEAYLGTRR
ncbi:hydrophobic amino acid ABC transporter ATP-binding protein [Nitratireductor indicus C115]|uniref:Hydrophobic amino acid ABC transporter ATP-binding protein n=1 Tax=Nitratireductor indicus C115 TaxID=1231190 RepID=K2PAN9_9HYPH|nr:ABC transporter ATP-binding protein [Nitratireductor indicus]EKF44196.1 hydrophobic amino acid ABC transporter ATP-binding protein [Nitratireductor indicus C115]SFQ25160.1 branched-chain amino acid transport system ATP-binding protein [Nitratireductor indicus]